VDGSFHLAARDKYICPLLGASARSATRAPCPDPSPASGCRALQGQRPGSEVPLGHEQRRESNWLGQLGTWHQAGLADLRGSLAAALDIMHFSIIGPAWRKLVACRIPPHRRTQVIPDIPTMNGGFSNWDAQPRPRPASLGSVSTWHVFSVVWIRWICTLTRSAPLSIG
jgi:hypothetical protein